MGTVIVLALLGVAAALAWPIPRLMARRHIYRRSPRAAVVAWQAVTLAALLAALFTPLAMIPALIGTDDPARHPGLLGLVGAVSGLLAAQLLVSGHRIGTELRRHRRRHRELVDIIAASHDANLRIIEHASPTAYCLPGRDHRVVLTRGALDALPADQLRAVVAHEEAHLRGRHDLLLEFFTVVHEAVPRPLRCDAALTEVRLLVEALADRAAVRDVGAVPTAKALLALAGARVPQAALGAAPVRSTVATRMDLLVAGDPPPALTAVIYGYAAATLSVPLALLAVAWS